MNEETKRERPWTPGPWEMQKAPSYGPCDMVERRNFSMSEGCGAQIWGYDGVEVDARAHLIACAPELFDALDAVVQWGNSPDGPLAWEVLAKARDALAKALGGQS